jgi:hypothetical protein
MTPPPLWALDLSAEAQALLEALVQQAVSRPRPTASLAPMPSLRARTAQAPRETLGTLTLLQSNEDRGGA